MSANSHTNHRTILDEHDRADGRRAEMPVLPDDQSNESYQRLNQVRQDQKNGHLSDPVNGRHHPIGMLSRLFENFRIFFPQVWLSELVRQVAWEDRFYRIKTAKWSYGYATNDECGTGSNKRMCDLVIHLRDEQGDAIIIGKSLPRGDQLDAQAAEHIPGSWLDLEDFNCATRHFIIYFVDESAREKTAAAIEDPIAFDPNDPQAPEHHQPARHRVLSWQDLAAIQMRLARTLPIHQTYRSYIASAIQWQFAQHGIRPSQLAFDYLANEKPLAHQHGSAAQHTSGKPLWHLDG